MDRGWKIAIIVLWILFILQNILFFYGTMLVFEEEEKINECYFNVCEDYEDAKFVDGLCTCLNYNSEIEDYEIKKQIYMR